MTMTGPVSDAIALPAISQQPATSAMRFMLCPNLEAGC
jgi:hypothetical protein